MLCFLPLSVRERTGVTAGLVGCIRMLDVNNRMLNIQEANGDSLFGVGVGECGNNPCQPNPCKNGAECQVKEAEMFHCKCSNAFWGKSLHCIETSDFIKTITHLNFITFYSFALFAVFHLILCHIGEKVSVNKTVL